MIAQRVHQFLLSLVLKESSCEKLARSFCLGIYIAFSPFIGLHTLMTFGLAWALRLNIPVTFAASCLIHNPWTTIPVYGFDYIFGEWLLKTMCGLDTMALNPAWVSSLNQSISYYLGLPHIAFWSFMVGGNLLGIACSVGLYPVMKRLFLRLIESQGVPATPEN